MEVDHDRYNYSRKFWFESGQDAWRVTESVIGSDWRVTILFGIGYVGTMLALQELLKPFPPLRLRYSLTTWNCFLAFVSLGMFLRLVPEVWFTVRHRGLQQILVHFPPDAAGEILHFWLVVNFWCKLIELGDTVFLVLRKRPLTFLHLFHHSSTVIFASFLVTQRAYWAPFRVYSVVNSFVHTCMYGYYLVASLGYKIPKSVSQCLTVAQIVQMVLFLVVIVVGANMEEFRKLSSYSIARRLLLILVLSNLALFFNYYLQTYVFKKRAAKKTE